MNWNPARPAGKAADSGVTIGLRDADGGVGSLQRRVLRERRVDQRIEPLGAEGAPPLRRDVRAFAKALATAWRGRLLRRETRDLGRRRRREIGPDRAGGERRAKRIAANRTPCAYRRRSITRERLHRIESRGVPRRDIAEDDAGQHRACDRGENGGKREPHFPF